MAWVAQLSNDVVLAAVPALMAALVAAMLYVMDPPLDRRVVLALTPWMVVGGAVHALYTADAYPATFQLRPFFGPMTVYFTTFVVAGMVWSMMTIASRLGDGDPRDAQYLTAGGVGAALAALLIVLSRAENTEAMVPAFGALVAAAVIASVAFLVVSLAHTTTLVQTGLLGLVVVFAHVLDGIMAAVSVELFGGTAGYRAGEWLLVRAAELPTAETLGVGWLVVAVKLVGAAAVVVVVASIVDRPAMRDRSWVGHVALGAVAAYGLGPGVHRFLSLIVG